MSKNSRLKIKIGSSFAKNEEQAVQELFDQIDQPEIEAVIFFCSSNYDLDKLGSALKNCFSSNLIGCTTAGEITSRGYFEGSLSGVSLGKVPGDDVLKIHSRIIPTLKGFSSEQTETIADSIQKDLCFSSTFDRDKMFGLLLIDGMSILEEPTIALLHRQFQSMPIIGGSAGDDLKFKSTQVYSDGQFISDAAVFSIIETTLPFHIFKTQHFQPTENKLVITEADPKNRIVSEIEGEPAAQAYAEKLGLTIDELSPMIFSSHPVMLKIGGEYYVRSIQKVNEDNSLTFYCAIDNGLVLTVAKGVDLVKNFQQQLSEIETHISRPILILGCDCILRRLEAQEKTLFEDLKKILANYNFIGFSTYGEQFNAVHVNQTLTGVAIGD
ncbi:MAG: histidine kinase [Desulfobacteraceae bacterium]|nr:histidine kinase [Desulfobacteraceae bacterium]